MLLSIEPDGPVPIYQQIRDQIVEAIADGQLPAGSGLPATRQLAVDLGINFHTVNKAYDLLRQEGLLRIGRKSGAVVQRDAASGPPVPGWEQDWPGRRRSPGRHCSPGSEFPRPTPAQRSSGGKSAPTTGDLRRWLSAAPLQRSFSGNPGRGGCPG
jgi:DNA-binding transcriptional MocR family regulator